MNYFSVFFSEVLFLDFFVFIIFCFKIEIGNRPVFEAFKFHCIIYQEALCAKTIQLGDVMEVVVKTVNVIRARGQSHREFQTFYPSLMLSTGMFFTILRSTS